MNLKKSLKMITRGGLPRGATLPRFQRSGSFADNKVPTKPDAPTKLEHRTHLGPGIFIGLGLAFILGGFLGWLSVNYTYGQLHNFFLNGGLDPQKYYLFSDLTDQMANFLTLILIGAATLLWGEIVFRTPGPLGFFSNKNPHALGGSLMALGTVLALAFARYLFLYILAPYYIENFRPPLEFSAIPFSVGVVLFACGILTFKRAAPTSSS